jgi:hypothetical protein
MLLHLENVYKWTKSANVKNDYFLYFLFFLNLTLLLLEDGFDKRCVCICVIKSFVLELFLFLPDNGLFDDFIHCPLSAVFANYSVYLFNIDDLAMVSIEGKFLIKTSFTLYIKYSTFFLELQYQLSYQIIFL